MDSDERPGVITSMAERLGRTGLWTSMRHVPDREAAVKLAVECETASVPALWLPGSIDNRSLRYFEDMLAATENLVVASGVANIAAEPPRAVVDVLTGALDRFPQRFLLGLGVSHAKPIAEHGLGSAKAPLRRMRSYLDGLAAAGMPSSSVVLGAQGPKMLGMAAERCAGCHPYLVTPEHTGLARRIVGAGLVMPEQTVAVGSDPASARATARAFLTRYLQFPNYTRNWEKLGLTEDLSGAPSDRLVDAIVVSGSPARVAERIRRHHDAGADHVAIQFLGEPAAALDAYREIATLV
ncbi:TIGR03620 family F420-dependent LLM class oxidoreductase [Actinophytocola sp.]|uniref:TIGR03620 family F420-dependent LLM class oxidoreductase n=1 Tax=Actinophytocola sp. TaxID=1872138 RepID=UPI003D6AD088